MKCKIPICNLCCQPEFDDNDVNRWLSGKEVGYCYSCSRKLNWKQTFLEGKTRRTKRNDEEDIREAEGNKDEVDEIQSEVSQNLEQEIKVMMSLSD